MKTVHTLLAVFYLLISCNNEKKNLAEKFDQLESEYDSLTQVHSTFKSTHQEMSKKHQDFKARTV